MNQRKDIWAGRTAIRLLMTLLVVALPAMAFSQGIIYPPTRKPPKKPQTQQPQRPQQSQQAQQQRIVTQEIQVGNVTFRMVRVDGGTFQMGSSSGESDERPVHSVTLSGYWIGETEVTQALWQEVMGSNPSGFKGSNLPVENVSWNDCKEFIRKLNTLTGRSFRLPTEAEWEYAARGGNRSSGYTYSGGNTLDAVGWYDGNSGGQTHPVKGKASNELGLYDMSGNVWEWCEDWYDSGYYANSPQNSPTGPVDGLIRVERGGSWRSYAGYCRVAFRNRYTPVSRDDNLGLRLALSGL